MNRRMRTRLRFFPVLCAGCLTLILLSGCQGHKVIARVNGDPILEEEYSDRLQRVNATDLSQNTPGLDAGGNVLVTMIQEKLLDQLAAKDHVVPTDEWLRTLESFRKHMDPRVVIELNGGPDNDARYIEGLKQQREMIGIGTDGARVEATDLQTEYNKQKSQLVYPEMFMVNWLPAPTQAQAQQAYDALKRTGDFNAAIQALGQSPPAGPPRTVVIADSPANNQSFLVVSSDPRQSPLPLPADFLKELRSLPVGQSLMKPVTLNLSITQGAPPTPRTLYFVVKLLSKQASSPATLAEATPALEMSIITQRLPDWQRHYYQQMADFTHSSSIQINITRYRPILAYIQTMQQQNLASAISNQLNGASAPGAGAPAPGSTPTAPSTGTMPPGKPTAPAPGRSTPSGGKAGPSGGPG